MNTNFLRERREREGSQNHVLVLLDWENLLISASSIAPDKFSIERGLSDLIAKITQEVGPIIGLYAFVSYHSATLWGEKLNKEGFFIIYCPKIATKTGEERDTTDGELSRFGMKMIEQMPRITHLCLGSGDQDFTPLLLRARERGLKIIFVVGSPQSLSKELIKFAEEIPGTEGKRIYSFLPRE